MNEIILTDKHNCSFYQGFLEVLLDLGNPEFPGKLWVNETGSECYAEFGEMYMDFSTFCESILTWPELSHKQHQKLEKLYNLLENYDRYLPDRKKTDEEICKDPEWYKVRNLAKIVYDDLKNVKYLPEERL